MSWNSTEVEEKLQSEVGVNKEEAKYMVKTRKTDILDKKRKEKIDNILKLLVDKEDE